jgi:preprotein translocase subunit SecG
MFYVLTAFHVLACFAIIGIVLLQAGKGADIGSAFGGAGSQAVFGSMGTPTILGKITTGVAILFAITSFSLALMGGERSSSVIRENAAPAQRGAAPAPSTPSANAPTPAAPSEPAPATPAPGQPAPGAQEKPK